ncbi:hypothetical protein SAMN04487884_1595 [Butyrivibrio fibrisolvens]|uniref:Uncharacterized protein n=1 Tax=Butyrivibrio fibrisolvens TaxID=831 RepID=A0A1H9XD23_BUTFI|nr:hypothetical protein SAMN04487884_1595 [Butyrivibrio fibrisolvens]
MIAYFGNVKWRRIIMAYEKKSIRDVIEDINSRIIDI